MGEKPSYVKVLQGYFSKEPHARKIEIAEFKKLTQKDKEDFVAMLRAEGYDVADPMSLATTEQK